MTVIDVSPTPSTRLGEILWLGTNEAVKHPDDGMFRSIGSYYLWLKTSGYPQVRFWPYLYGYQMLSKEIGVDLNTITPEQTQRLNVAIQTLLEEQCLWTEFVNPATKIQFHHSVPRWYSQLLLNLRNSFVS